MITYRLAQRRARKISMRGKWGQFFTAMYVQGSTYYFCSTFFTFKVNLKELKLCKDTMNIPNNKWALMFSSIDVTVALQHRDRRRLTNLKDTNNLKSSQDQLMVFVTAQYRSMFFIRKDNDHSFVQGWKEANLSLRLPVNYSSYQIPKHSINKFSRSKKVLIKSLPITMHRILNPRGSLDRISSQYWSMQ